ncbi:hypothetical protein RI570_10305 [Brucella pseudogrignonensis]|uniref:hypothetical protein n=1 Tax=Brucella pseudogrignonensis TaxID=419475 RepID=UPI0028B7DC13|nr:hypothetical protein [Brucella pseudogrignonensis]MDT6940539.1 hypothetical protein [Brucella pseudogrignonensis]
MTGPIEQFAIKPIVELGTLVGQQIVLKNSALYKLLTVMVAAGSLFIASSRTVVVPERLQSSAEMLHDFVSQTTRENAGQRELLMAVIRAYVFTMLSNTPPIKMKFYLERTTFRYFNHGTAHIQGAK